MPSSLEPFSGTETFSATPERVFAVLTNLDALASAMPGLVSSEKVDQLTLKAVVKPGTGGVIQRRARPRPNDCTFPVAASESSAR